MYYRGKVVFGFAYLQKRNKRSYYVVTKELHLLDARRGKSAPLLGAVEGAGVDVDESGAVCAAGGFRTWGWVF